MSDNYLILILIRHDNIEGSWATSKSYSIFLKISQNKFFIQLHHLKGWEQGISDFWKIRTTLMYKTVKLVCLFNGLMIGLGRKDEYSSLHAFLLVAFIWGGGGTSTRDPSGMCHQHDMDSKVSLSVYEWPFKTCNIWYVNGLIFQNLSQTWIKFIPRFLTLKWSRRVPMDPKISFRADARKRKVSWRCRFLTFTCLPPRIFWHVFGKKIAPRVAQQLL